MSRFTSPLLTAAFLAASVPPAAAQFPPSGFEVGEPFPTMAFPDLDGNPVSIADYRGGKVILHIFASW